MLKEVSEHSDTFEQFLEDYVFTPEGFEGYLAKVGPTRLREIKADPRYGYSRSINRENGTTLS